MSGPTDDAAEDGPAGSVENAWPLDLDGVTESVVTTLGPNDLWNVAALGIHAPGGGVDAGEATPLDAVTWGNTRTRRNFERRREGVVQFVSDPRDFVDAALTIREESQPVLGSADAWVRVDAESLEEGVDEGTEWKRWQLTPREGAVVSERPFSINRGFFAVVDATVAASRLDVAAYDTDRLLDRLEYYAETVDACGGPREREAFARLSTETAWRDRR